MADGVTDLRGVHVRTALRTNEGTDFTVNRVLPVAGFEHLDPLVLLDELGPDIPAGDKTGFEVHPHAGLEVFSYVLEGFVEGQLHWPDERPMIRAGAGDTMWINFGAGGAHYERPPRDVIDHGGRCHVVQLWFALPSEAKKVASVCEAHFATGQNPIWTSNGGDVRVRLLIGRAFGLEAPARISNEASYMHVTLAPGAEVTLPIPGGHVAMAYVLSGTMRTSEGQYAGPRQSLAISRGHANIPVAASGEGVDFLFVTGRPNDEPIVQVATFVMNTMDEIGDCFRSYGRFLNIDFD